MTNDPAMLGTGSFERTLGDRYFTEPWVTQALLDKVRFRSAIWEPACGRGDMVRVMIEAGYTVVASDIAGDQLGCNLPFVDFLTCCLPTTCSIVTNPPYFQAEAFIKKALGLTLEERGMVAMLLRNEYDCAASRRDLFKAPFAMKLVLTKRPRWIDSGHTASPRHNFAWYIWDHQHTGPAQIAWIP